MTRATMKTVFAAAAATAVAWLVAGALDTAAAQSSAAPSAAEKKPGPAPKMADGHPDLSGVWWGGGDVGGRGFRPGGGPPAGGGAPPATFTSLYKPQAAERAKTLSDKDDPTLRCQSTAFGTLNVSLLNTGFVGQIVQTPKFMVFLSETNPTFRLIPTDGRPHREEQPPSSRGDSVGHWDGDVFVVETKNYSDRNWMHAEGEVSFHSESMRVVERYRRIDRKIIRRRNRAARL